MIYVKRIWTWRNKVVRLTGINQVNFVFVREYLFLSEVVWLSHSKTQTGKQRTKTRMRSSTSTYTQTQALHEYSSTPSLHICRCILGRIALEAVLSTRIMWRHLHKDMEELESHKGWQLAFSTGFLHIAGEHHATTRWELGWTPFVCVIPWCTQGGWDTPCILPHVPWVQWLKQLNVITNSDRTDFVTSSSSIASPRRQRAGAVFSVSWWHVDWL